MRLIPFSIYEKRISSTNCENESHHLSCRDGRSILDVKTNRQTRYMSIDVTHANQHSTPFSSFRCARQESKSRAIVLPLGLSTSVSWSYRLFPWAFSALEYRSRWRFDCWSSRCHCHWQVSTNSWSSLLPRTIGFAVCDETRMCEAHDDVAHLHRDNRLVSRAEISQHLVSIPLSALRSTALDASVLSRAVSSRSLVSLLPLVLYKEEGTMK